MTAFGLVTIGASLHFLKISLHFPKKQGDSALKRVRIRLIRQPGSRVSGPNTVRGAKTSA
jgi:hypothetical protein